MNLHVSPLDDLIEHDLIGDDCICGPTDKPSEGEDGEISWITVHHSLDGREFPKEPSITSVREMDDGNYTFYVMELPKRDTTD